MTGSSRIAHLAARSENAIPRVRPTDEEYTAVRDSILAGWGGNDAVWVLGISSLIWKPGFDPVKERVAVARGWRRAFCQGWLRSFRGTPERPAVMLALDRGGSCKGVALRLREGEEVATVDILLRREMPYRRTTPPARWLRVETAKGPLRAITFPIHRKSPAYLPGLPEDVVVEMLATACGEGGSMAEYLLQTVVHLEARGIHDSYLWRLQHLVADRLERGEPPDAAG